MADPFSKQDAKAEYLRQQANNLSKQAADEARIGKVTEASRLSNLAGQASKNAAAIDQQLNNAAR